MQSAAPFLRLGTRGSPLALAQANLVARLLSERYGVPVAEIEICVITTTGDRLTDRPLSEAGGKGLFSKEIEAAIATGQVDVGVHSSKDMATTLPDGLVLSTFLQREDVRDAFVSHDYASIDELPAGSKLGSSSIRRAAQMLRERPDIEVVPFRGNVQTRLGKLEQGIATATLLAAAGLNRLGMSSLIRSYLDPRRFPPAPAQGAIGLEHRADDTRTAELLAPLDHGPTSIAIAAERAMLAELDGSCRTPIGAFTELNESSCTLHGEILSPDGTQAFNASLSGTPGEARALGTQLGRNLLELAGPAFMKRLQG